MRPKEGPEGKQLGHFGILIREDFWDIIPGWNKRIKAILAIGYLDAMGINELSISQMAQMCNVSKSKSSKIIKALELDGWIQTFSYIPQRNFSGKIICENCGYQTGTLQPHHIVPRKDHGGDEPDNIIMLCPNCHAKVHTLHFAVTDKFTTYIKYC